MKKFVALYVPSTDNKTGETLTSENHGRIADRVAVKFTAHFGGATVTEAVGYWEGENGIVREKIIVVKSFVDDGWKSPLFTADKILKETAVEIKELLSQECVSIETEEGLEFV